MTGGRGRRVPMPPPPRHSAKNWAIVCDGGVTPDGDVCAQEWATNSRDTVDLGAVELHFSIEHPDVTKIAFRIAWRGKGPEPAARVENRADRRRKAKKKGRS